MDASPEVYEVFGQSQRGEPHVHVGAVNAGDPEMALLVAQYVYGRRDGWTSLWVTPRSAVHRTTEAQEAEFERMKDRTYRQGDGFNREAKKERGVLPGGGNAGGDAAS